jgi:hypothetical protein
MRSVRAPPVKSAAKSTINTKVFMGKRQNLPTSYSASIESTADAEYGNLFGVAVCADQLEASGRALELAKANRRGAMKFYPSL